MEHGPRPQLPVLVAHARVLGEASQRFEDGALHKRARVAKAVLEDTHLVSR
jgi:hypothetical protein